MKKYVVKRDSTYAGLVIKKSMDFQALFNETLDTRQFKVFIPDGEDRTLRHINDEVLRGVLFYNFDGRAEDLLYDSPSKYLIQKANGNEQSEFMITDPINLGMFLKYYGFDENLTRQDLNKIADLVFAHKSFFRKHPDIYGDVLEMMASKNTYMVTAGEQLYDKLEKFYQVPIVPSEKEPNFQYIHRKK